MLVVERLGRSTYLLRFLLPATARLLLDAARRHV
jgi:hypothetical protein